MKRREFIKTAVVVPTALAFVPSFALADQNPFGIANTTRRFAVTNSYSFAASKEAVRLWIPLPFETDYQKIISISHTGNFDQAKIVSQENHNKVLYAEWSKDKKERNLKLEFAVATMPRSTIFAKATGKENYTEKEKEFLKGTAHVPVNDKLKKFASEITKDKAPLKRARALYNWVTTNMYRDESVRGCGVGDAGKAIDEKLFGGKCTDISSVFVALLRNSNIPAREAFGIRLGKSLISPACGGADDKGFAKISGGQHCRVEFFIDGIGWVPADPADVAKVKLAEKLDDKSKKLADVRDYFFGSWEMNWVAFNYSRDFVLEPKPVQYPLNMLGYPYAEMGEDVLDYYDPASFTYSYTSQELV